MDSNNIERINYVFRNYPLVSPIMLILSIAIVGFAILDEQALGYVFIVIGCIGYIYVLARYVIIGYRLFSGFNVQKEKRTSLLVTIDLKFAEFLMIGGIITGMYFTDTTPGRTRFIQHNEFSANANPFEAWAYIVSFTVFVLFSTGFASVVEAHLAIAIILTVGVIVSKLSELIILTTVVEYWANSRKTQQHRKRRKKQPQKIKNFNDHARI